VFLFGSANPFSLPKNVVHLLLCDCEEILCDEPEHHGGNVSVSEGDEVVRVFELRVQVIPAEGHVLADTKREYARSLLITGYCADVHRIVDKDGDLVCLHFATHGVGSVKSVFTLP
jgi:hypothetical protein